MNILLINHYAGSDLMGMEYRPFYLAREWVADGHKVTIVGASFSHLRNKQPVADTDLAVTEEDGVRFRWLRTRPYQGNGVDRIVNILTFVSKLTAYAGRIAREERPDVVICSSTYPLDIYPGERIARMVGARLVFEVHDLWPLTPMLLGGYSPNHPYIRLLQHAEDRAYRNADTVISILPNVCDYMAERGMDLRKFVHVPNGIPVAAFQKAVAGELSEAVAARIAAERARGRFLMGYAGGINMADAIGTVLDAAALLKDEPVSFILAGGGQGADEFRARVEATGLDNFHLVGVIPKPTVQDFLQRMDALVVSWPKSPLYRFGVSPNKMFDYMLAGRPVVQCSNASNDLAREGACGFTVPPEDPDALADVIRQLVHMDPAERAALGQNGRRFVQENHDYRVLASRFIAAAAAT
ncbi:glycosyltransferase family 4 protein [Azospirillum rugosum]|uniref:Glycosyltransferase involved in cell wall biosynthesis n=1 Tax=Azospirillum rugosum TaxID=416170 RepID=A0ABS4SFE1_9PROT|nr:glycosyltransferase family 4 protein [Azospirillum rugosum]MBP2291284.1 glycosyltransferase involved in cell wall biosynthesis [Azospirillum rugosum]MDQ0525072.1 glycosyltransferase involved in cell wall biosynthesis [Azospirillum rugosum]